MNDSIGKRRVKNNTVKLIALDLDGTLFGPDGKISENDRAAIRDAVSHGIEVVISSGRPYVGLPHEQMQNLGIRYAITVNGAAVYRSPEKECLFCDPISLKEALPVIQELKDRDIYCDVFVDGDGYGWKDKLWLIDAIPFSDSVRAYKKATRKFVDDLEAWLIKMDRPVQKITLDFLVGEDGNRVHREETKQFLKGLGRFNVVCGGGMDLEITSKTVSKAMALSELADRLGLSIQNIMAIGDAGNDMDMIQAAGIGVAMGNAEQDIKKAADFVTTSNSEDGVAHAIRSLVLINQNGGLDISADPVKINKIS